jgi:phospholipase C
MSRPNFHRVISASAVGLAMGLTIASAAAGDGATGDHAAVSPIKHVIVIIGENRSFDHVYATYQPVAGQSVANLLSRGIVTADGAPGPNYALAAQRRATDSDRYAINPGERELYAHLPPPGTEGAPTDASDRRVPPYATLDYARRVEPDLPQEYYRFLLSGATGLPMNAVDTRIGNYDHLPSGPFPLTPSVSYDDYTASPVHRFYQMWQQLDCNPAHATPGNPSGCLNDLYAWVNVSVGGGSDGNAKPANFTDITTGYGGSALGFYNVQHGDAPYMKLLADRYTLSDNMHQSVQGGTGVNHIMFGFADDIWYSDGKGAPAVPPAPQIENPDPQAGTNDWYSDDGYSGGSYTACADRDQPGVASVVLYLHSLARPIDPKCESNHYYLLNNYAPGYKGDGSLNRAPFTIPPTSVRHIGDVLMERNISFAYYGEGWNIYTHGRTPERPFSAYCEICNPFQYATDIMTNPALRQAHIQDTDSLYRSIADGSLPAVAIVKPSEVVDGHPASSKLDLFEGFAKKIIDAVQANPALWRETAIFVTFDEGGGYYDSGYVQPLDFFGDGTRVPLLIVSPYSTGGKITHAYADHVSIIKFIERNWRLKPITARSRDNLPNPKVGPRDPYVPLNSPALGDLWDAFQFR